MKKLLPVFFCFVALLYHHVAFAQPNAGHYWINVYTSFVFNWGHDSRDCTIESYTAGKQFLYQHWDGLSGERLHTITASSTPQRFLATQRPQYIYFYGHRRVPEAGTDTEYNTTRTVSIANRYPQADFAITKADDGNDLYDGYSMAITQITIKPDSISLFYFDANGVHERVSKNTISRALPTDDNITLKATTGFDASIYNRLSYTINYPATTGLPSESGTISMGGNSVKTLKGTDFLSRAKFEYIIKNKGTIQFIVDYPNANKCETITLNPMLSAPKIVSAQGKMPTCNGSSDGTITIKLDRKLYANERLYISTGTNFKKNSTMTAAHGDEITIGGFAAGNYNIRLLGSYRFGTNLKDTVATYTDGLNHKKDNVTVPNRPAITTTVSSITPVNCADGADGKFNLRITGGNNPYTVYIIDNTADTIRKVSGIGSGSTRTFNNFPKGNYTVYVKDSKGCERNPRTQTVSINALSTAPVLLSHIAESAITGYGLSNGMLQVSAAGGTPNYTFSWQKQNPLHDMSAASITNNNISTLNNISAGTYFVTVKDNNFATASPTGEINENSRGCIDTMHIVINQPAPLITKIELTDSVICHGDSNGRLQTLTSGGKPFTRQEQTLPYNYKWFKIENDTDIPLDNPDSTFGNLPAGNYKVQVIDKNNNTASHEFYLTQPDKLTATAEALQQVMCDGDNTGSAQVSVTGGIPPYSYDWSTGSNDATITNLSREKYTVVVTDARYIPQRGRERCSATAFVEIASPEALQVYDTIIRNPSCYQSANGRIELFVKNGVKPYRYLWEGGDNTAGERSKLTAGTYRVTITDNNNCRIHEEYTLSEPAPVTVDLGADFTLCAGQEITLADKNNTNEEYNYLWTSTDSTVLSTDPEWTVTAAGTYILKATASAPANCEGSDTIVVRQSNDVVQADFVISSTVARNKNLHVVNITQSTVDSVAWIVPNEAVEVEKTADNLTVSFDQTGEYSIGFVACMGQCQDILYKTVQVVDAYEMDEYATEPFLKRFIVSPNPNDGNFTAIVELREETDYQLLLFNDAGTLLDSKAIKNSAGEHTLFNKGDLVAGVYYLRFVAQGHTSVFTIIKAP